MIQGATPAKAEAAAKPNFIRRALSCANSGDGAIWPGETPLLRDITGR
ncbi:hypothetical protein FHS61_002992 [Altererythrobacter atlanticus]|uniref:Uncharacterized protein n=1 Tax=Croceibacterium atlanticum TaxID=1267766 RepID=A0A0F7KVI2_9SPHN|nr:hypothetical protein WYH_03319 [Croceibacterium atlanticum]MBB5733945.1 hypothetical protein [Croceibacterium atlanticum]